jgi:ABC-type glutathione transport system ATPase component
VATSADQLLYIKDLSVSYISRNGESLPAIVKLSIELQLGEILGIAGESGCGKSTLAHAVLGLLPANAKCETGQILFAGNYLQSLTERELRCVRGRQISLVPQDPALSLNPVIAVGTQIAEVLRAHLPLTSSQRRDRVMELLEEVGFDQLSQIYRAYPHQLSGGQRQRIVIAQAIACRPALLIADEPTSKLDVGSRSEMVSLLAHLRARHRMALIVITHDFSVVAAIADRVAFMYRGSMVDVGKCEEVFRRPTHPYTQALLRIARSTRIDVGTSRQRFPTIDSDDPDPAATTIKVATPAGR